MAQVQRHHAIILVVAIDTGTGGVVNRVLDSGYQVLALSTCTGIDSYNKDDRMVALNLRHLVNDLGKGLLVGGLSRT